MARVSVASLSAQLKKLRDGEPLALLGWVGILVLISGVLLLSLRGGRALERIDVRSLASIASRTWSVCVRSAKKRSTSGACRYDPMSRCAPSVSPATTRSATSPAKT